ncbi:hypothetical protein FUAX_05150 [Fulvitalea axinellae]|uniref:Carboxypeptidase regulatory-like domain-containing protein n=1 Tax=Fulvitalea axinellae TaxID=1182444 RepID=A0AAU9CE50_9BACT|nr:hypothetical protein FUAX_05150 [Fulvitalea axinellae]
MKNKFLKLNNPCDEKWENMKPNRKGRYCDLCSKNIIDFTGLNQTEISEIIEKPGKRICARLTRSQLNAPIFSPGNDFKLNLPKSNVAAGLIIASALTVGQTLHAENLAVETELSPSPDKVLRSKKEKTNYTEPNEPKSDDFIIFKGIVTSKDLGKPVENSKITFVSPLKLYIAYSAKDGTFSMKIPADLIDNDNVIRVSYYDIKEKRNKDSFFQYETTDYILPRHEMTTEFAIEADPEEILLGEIDVYTEIGNPIVLSNGTEIKYREFAKAQLGKKSSCNLENKEYLYFDPDFAIAIYGQKAKDGLFILIDKTGK